MSAPSPSDCADLLDGLNPPQRAAVLHREGPLLVLAGPGSGKTRVITRRAAYLVQTGVAPSQILCITFTNKAADEMKRRIAALGAARGMWVCTFHALAVRLMRLYPQECKVKLGFSIYDDAEQTRLIKAAMQACHVNPDIDRPDRMAALISSAKNDLLTPREFEASARYSEQLTAARVYAAYQKLLDEQNAVDFDDLLMRVARMLRTHADVCEQLNQRFQFVLVDEYQDTNFAQYLIAQQLSRMHGNLCVTGDPDQSIYAWRGANIDNILNFERDHPSARVVKLEQNYRSSGVIVRAASRLIAANLTRKSKQIWTENALGEPIDLRAFFDGEQEAADIAATIVREHAAGRPFSDFAIFYRANAVSRGLEDALRMRQVPYRIARGVEFYSRREIKDLLAYLRLLVNPFDELALLRAINTPARGIGKTTLDRLQSVIAQRGATPLEVLRRADQEPTLRSAAPRLLGFAALLDRLQPAADESVPDTVSRVLTQSGLEASLKEEDAEDGEDRLANAQELVTAASAYAQRSEAPTLEEFLQSVALTSDQDAVDESAGVVMLMTLHAAKGLEFPFVFLVACEQGLLPHENSLRAGQIEEERRLCFVGMTRARERLVLTHAAQRRLRGVLTPRARSEFLLELPAELTRQVDRTMHDDSSTRWQRRAARDEPDGRQAYGAASGPDELGYDARAANAPLRQRAQRRLFDDGAAEPVYSPDDPTPGAPPPRGPAEVTIRGLVARHDGQAQALRRGPDPGDSAGAGADPREHQVRRQRSKDVRAREYADRALVTAKRMPHALGTSAVDADRAARAAAVHALRAAELGQFV